MFQGEFYHGSIVSGPAYVLSSVQPVHQSVQRVIADSPDIPQDVDGQDDVRTLLSQNHPANAGLLTEEQETRGSCRQRGRKDGGMDEGMERRCEHTEWTQCSLCQKGRLKFAQCIL